MSKNDKCGFCDHFEREEGMFGGCLLKQSEHRDPATFSMDVACEFFTPKTNQEFKDTSISFIKNLDNAKPNPHMAMLGLPGLLQMLFNNGNLPFAIGMQDSCPSCSNEETSKEEPTEWQNPVVRRKPRRKVIPWEEVKQRILNKQQVGNTSL